MALSQFDERKPFLDLYVFDSTSGTGYNGTFSPNNDPTRLDSVLLSNNDAIDHIVRLALENGGTFVPIGAVNVPAGSGYTAAAVEALSLLLPLEQRFVIVTVGASVQVAIPVAITLTKEVDVGFLGGRL